MYYIIGTIVKAGNERKISGVRNLFNTNSGRLSFLRLKHKNSCSNFKNVRGVRTSKPTTPNYSLDCTPVVFSITVTFYMIKYRARISTERIKVIQLNLPMKVSYRIVK